MAMNSGMLRCKLPKTPVVLGVQPWRASITHTTVCAALSWARAMCSSVRSLWLQFGPLLWSLL